MSCKHEELHVLGAEGYFCASPRCNKLYEGEVVILTKAQHDKMDAVVEASKTLKNRTMPYEDESGVITIALAHWANFLTALEGE